MGRPKGWKPPPGWVNPTKGVPLNRGTLAERFWQKVDKRGPDDCWPWTASLDSKGYGQIYSGHGNKNMQGHSASMLIHGHKLPAGKEWDHICKDRTCVNPAHLRAVTHRENCGIYSDSPWGKNTRKEKCSKGHPFTDDNIAVIYRAQQKPRPDGSKRSGKVRCRVCLTCFPSYWKHALVPRTGRTQSLSERGCIE